MITEIVIPELEALAGQEPDYLVWSPEEEAVLHRYYGRGRVTPDDLKEHLPGRTVGAIQSKASALGLTRRRA